MSDISTSDSATMTAAGNGRDSQGRFVKGNRGGPGNPFARRTAALRVALCAALTEDDVRAIVLAMKEKAKAGDVAAAKLVLGYAVGRPVEVVNPDTLDEAEMEQYLQQPALAAGLPSVLAAPAPDLCCRIVRAARPGIVRAMATAMGKAILTGQAPGTGEQICAPLAGEEGTGREQPGSDMGPSANGDNGKQEAARTRTGRDRERGTGAKARHRKAATRKNGARVLRHGGPGNERTAQRQRATKQERRRVQGKGGNRRSKGQPSSAGRSRKKGEAIGRGRGS